MCLTESCWTIVFSETFSHFSTKFYQNNGLLLKIMLLIILTLLLYYFIKLSNNYGISFYNVFLCFPFFLFIIYIHRDCHFLLRWKLPLHTSYHQRWFLRVAFNFLGIRHIWQINSVSFFGLTGSAWPTYLLYTTMCLPSVDDDCKPCCKQHRYCWKDDEACWHSWLASTCHDNLSDDLHNLPLTAVYIHTHNISKIAY